MRRRTGAIIAAIVVAATGCGGSETATQAGGANDSAPTVLPTSARTAPDTTAAPATLAPTTAPAPTTSTSTTAAPRSSTTSSTAPSPTDAPGIDPGTLPQTRDKPAASSPVLDAHARELWDAIVKDDPSLALPFFFPEAAYLQVKDIADAAGDYHRRLIAAYEEDIHALHTKLGADPSKASFTALTVPNTAQWIDPGVEYNKGGYWRVYGSQLGYTLNGKNQSFNIASMISWRGQWYVVHLNSIR